MTIICEVRYRPSTHLHELNIYKQLLELNQEINSPLKLGDLQLIMPIPINIGNDYLCSKSIFLYIDLYLKLQISATLVVI
jgi:hypothetical protein